MTASGDSSQSKYCNVVTETCVRTVRDLVIVWLDRAWCCRRESDVGRVDSVLEDALVRSSLFYICSGV